MTSARPQATHHARILEDLRGRILDGRWAPGHQLDKETDLAEAHGVSRMTMNKVLTQLAQEGYLVRRRRGGTFVAQPRAQSAVMEINDIGAEVAALGLIHGWTLLRREIMRLGAAERALLDMPADAGTGEVLFLQGLHSAQGAPFCLETRAINLAAAPAARDMAFDATPPGTWLTQTKPWTAARNTLRAIGVEGAEARHLGLPVGAACLLILRKTRSEPDWVTCVRLVYSGEAHQLVAEFEPGRAS